LDGSVPWTGTTSGLAMVLSGIEWAWSGFRLRLTEIGRVQMDGTLLDSGCATTLLDDCKGRVDVRTRIGNEGFG
jgi:hypothetical protein